MRRRAAGRLEEKLNLGALELDLVDRELRWNGERVPMSPLNQITWIENYAWPF